MTSNDYSNSLWIRLGSASVMGVINDGIGVWNHQLIYESLLFAINDEYIECRNEAQKCYPDTNVSKLPGLCYMKGWCGQVTLYDIRATEQCKHIVTSCAHRFSIYLCSLSSQNYQHNTVSSKWTTPACGVKTMILKLTCNFWKFTGSIHSVVIIVVRRFCIFTF